MQNGDLDSTADHDQTEFWLEAYRSGEYLENWHYDHPSPELVALVTSGIIRPGSSVLEVGCGAGTDSIYLARTGMNVTGWDISPAAVELARKAARTAGVRANFQNVDIFSPMVPRTSVDAVVDRGCLHNIPLHQWPEFARRVHRFLRRDSGIYFVRGSRDKGINGYRFTPLTPENLNHGFSMRFRWGRVEQFMLLSNTTPLPGVMVLMRSKTNVR